MSVFQARCQLLAHLVQDRGPMVSLLATAPGPKTGWGGRGETRHVDVAYLAWGNPGETRHSSNVIQV